MFDLEKFSALVDLYNRGVLLDDEVITLWNGVVTFLDYDPAYIIYDWQAVEGMPSPVNGDEVFALDPCHTDRWLMFTYAEEYIDQYAPVILGASFGDVLASLCDDLRHHRIDPKDGCAEVLALFEHKHFDPLERQEWEDNL